jgi:hypothetical protein
LAPAGSSGDGHAVFAETNWFGRMRYVNDTIHGPDADVKKNGAGFAIVAFIAGITIGVFASIYLYEGSIPVPSWFPWP